LTSAADGRVTPGVLRAEGEQHRTVGRGAEAHGIVMNQNTAEDTRRHPYFVEVERKHDEFEVASVAVGQAINQLAASGTYFTEDNYFIPAWYLKTAECPTLTEARKAGVGRQGIEP
jgi:hypothetical protein